MWVFPFLYMEAEKMDKFYIWCCLCQIGKKGECTGFIQASKPPKTGFLASWPNSSEALFFLL